MTIADRLLRILSDGQVHSTQHLATELGTTPNAIRVTLGRLHERGKIVSFPGANSNTPASWGLTDKHHGLSVQ
jgi:predicted ArsR family transcriptional regulator